MLFEHMIPCHVVHLDKMALGVANPSDDVASCDPPRLGVSADENLQIRALRRVFVPEPAQLVVLYAPCLQRPQRDDRRDEPNSCV
jgi:hypothetical protein